MRLKSYFAATVEGALGFARQELGPDAMLVDSRRTSADTRHLGEYEVVFAASSNRFDPAKASETHSVGTPSLDRLSTEVAEMKRYMERMAQVISSANSSFSTLRLRPELSPFLAKLGAAGVDSEIAQQIVIELSEAIPIGSDPEQALLERLTQMVGASPSIGRKNASRKIVALVGPPGSGKTATLVKVAARFGLVSRRPAQIISLDTYRVAASEQLRAYASILGIAFQICETTQSLSQSLEEQRTKELILIDTPGFAPAEMEDARSLGELLSSHAEVDTHFVAPATAKSNDLKAWAKAYEIFSPSKLIFTKLDETTTFGSLLNLCCETNKPISFLGFGQQIPEDLETAVPRKVAEMILGARVSDSKKKSAVAAA